MTLVDHDEVEKVRRELLIDILLLLRATDRLVKREVDFESFIGASIGNLRHRLAEGLEVVGLGLVGKNVAIDEKEDALLGARFPKPPDDLESGVGFARACGHHEQDALLPARDGLHGAVDGD